MNTQICIAISYQWKHRWCVMIWYDMVLRMLVFIRHQTGVNHEHVSHGRLAQAAHWPSPDNNAAAVPCPLSGDNWWVLLLCHLGQETLHTGTSPWPLHSTFKLDLNCVPVKLHKGVMRFLSIYTFYHMLCQIFPIFPEKYHCPLPCQLAHVTSRLTLTHPTQAFSSETMFQLFILLAHNTFKHSPLTFMHITCTWQFKLRQGRLDRIKALFYIFSLFTIP